MEQKKPNGKEALLSEINALRKEMIRIGMSKGLNHNQTIELSQKLDIALNKYSII
ncbi:aspartyl-phosphate phosphatase Spo0E family protein [Siminovitchia sp. 179-K 8D1 HS]|uniref:aspartyl-phosphate phosphatase Spo0E family protein n=1 Tax=Siminovitchia sp. 179-K 8D1 HS TaxID=3142385 RepID=UPI0039A1AE39